MKACWLSWFFLFLILILIFNFLIHIWIGSSIADAVEASNKPINELIDIDAKWDEFSSRIQANQLLIRKIEDEFYTKIRHETDHDTLTELREDKVDIE